MPGNIYFKSISGIRNVTMHACFRHNKFDFYNVDYWVERFGNVSLV